MACWYGANNKEVEAQRNRIGREREVIYRVIQEIPSEPREAWGLQNGL